MIRTGLVLSLSLLVSASALARAAVADPQTVVRAQPSVEAPTEYFTGKVLLTPLFPANDSVHLSGALVTFEPAARTAWHTHPAGQRLLVTGGFGWIQEWGGPIMEIRAGDVVWFRPGIKHWHGASPTAAMAHIALTGEREGKYVDWLEKVSEQQYKK